ncbi:MULTISPECIES: YHS domain-containing (seleno)protein [Bosea]|jgi:hypothetical protein|uniref:YHS domain-containing (seleno)protein n=1 Tax=Bosea TaxID=85413 RepID=UPI00286BDF35|nr:MULTISPECIES: YHS domain-containing (seleno)protein [Bosea]
MEELLLNRRGLLILATGSVGLPTRAHAAKPNQTKTTPVNTLGSGEAWAIRGYDPVAYFRESAPRQGLAEHALIRDEAVWRFASAENKALFKADPQRYLPAYGGFCAYGTSRGYLVKIEPEAWSIVGGRLFLNYDLDTRATWLSDTEAHIMRADTLWPTLSDRDIR